MSLESKKVPSSYLANISLLLFSTLISFAGADLVFDRLKLVPDVFRIQVGAEKSAYRLSDNPVLGYEMKENWRDRKNPDNYLTYSFTNAHGQRDIERTIEKKPGARRIILLGDSVVAASYVADLNDTISRKLEILYEQEKKPVEVLNFGMTGYSTMSETELLRVKGVKFSPDLVILVYVDNDIWDMSGLVHELVKKRADYLNWMFIHSSIFRFFSLRYNLFDFQAETDPGYYARKHEQAVGKDNVRHALPLLKKLAAEDHFRLLIVVWPRFTDNEITEGEMHKVNPETQELQVEELAHEFGIPIQRLSPLFRADYEERLKQGGGTAPVGPNRLYTVGDSQHPGAEGAKTAAKFLKQWIEQHPDFLGLSS